MKKKSESFSCFKRFKAWAENLTGKKIKWFRDDKGGEYISKEFQNFLDECGISREHTVRNRPQQNGIVALLEESGLSRKYWAECLAALIHILNRCPTSAVEGKTPHEVLVVVGHCICMAGTSLNLVLVGLVFEGPVSRLKNIATGLDQDQKRLDILHAVMSSLIYQRLILCGPRT